MVHGNTMGHLGFHLESSRIHLGAASTAVTFVLDEGI